MNTPPLAIIPTSIISDPRIGDAAIRTLIALASHCNQDRIAWPSVSKLAKMLNKQKRAVQSDLRKLAEAGYIKIIPQFRDNSQTTNKYQVVFDVDMGVSLNDMGGCRSTTRGGVAEQHGGGVAEQHPEQNHLTVNKKKDNQKMVVDNFEGDDFAIEQADVCWDYWAANDKFPKGDALAAFRGWLRNSKPKNRNCSPSGQEKQNSPIEVENNIWRKRIEGYAKTGFWASMWGKRPDEAGTDAPAHLTQEILNGQMATA